VLSRPAGAGHLDREGEDLPGARPGGQPFEVGDVAVGWPPFGGADEQGPPVRAAEHQRERRPVLLEFDALQDLAALGDAVLRKRWIAGALSDRRFASAVEDLEQLDLDRYPTLRFMRRAYELRTNVTAYDSTYVALAETLDCELLTADQRLASATGPRCAIRVLRP
jgi:predicted nucleic acid-binding protein